MNFSPSFARPLSLAAAIALLCLVTAAAPAYAASATPITASRSAVVSVPPANVGGDDTAAPEFDGAMVSGDADNGSDEDSPDSGSVVNRTIAKHAGKPVSAIGKNKAKSNPELSNSFDGVNFFDQRFSNGGNQFSVEPPDQAMCAGNGFVLESANDVLRIFNSSGANVAGPVDLNTFYGYAAAVNRSANPLTFGPSLTDPSCYYDNDTQRWLHVVLTLDRAVPTSQALAGTNHLDIAVSTTADPTGSWTVYHIPVQNDGTQGTPDHGCIGNRTPPFVHGPCLGDYPHIGADANGFYITTNEFDLAGPFFHGAQIYAFSKHQLAANSPTVNGVLYDTTDASLLLQPDGVPGFTVWPAQSPAGKYNTANGGTEYLLSSNAVFQDTGFDTRLRVWTLTNTSALDSGGVPNINHAVANVEGYGVPGSSAQKVGNVPLRDCIAVASCAAAVGSVRFDNVEGRLPSNDSRMQQVSYANGRLWGSLDTGLVFEDNPNVVIAGIAYFAINPNSLTVAKQGYIGLENNNLTYPALAVNQSGRGAIAFTVVGPDYFPSAGYASLDTKIGAGDIHVAASGAGPQDGFSEYISLSQNSLTRIRPRWGDYGAAAVDGGNIWIASEYIGQTCTFTQYQASPFGRCGGTRGSLGNWDTRVSKLSIQ